MCSIAGVRRGDDADSYGITEQQAVLFCICMEKGPRRVDYDDLATHLDLSKINILSYANDMDALVRRRRFLYKIRFEKPTAEVRAHIWHE